MKKTHVLLAGVDTLLINAKQKDEQGTPKKEQQLPAIVEVQLKEWQEQAKADNHPYATAWVHEGQTLMMYPNGTSGWTFLLKNGLIDLMFGALLNNASLVRIRFSSEYLWRRGVFSAVKEVQVFLTRLLGEVLYMQLSEIHLCADVIGLTIPNNYERVFVSRAKLQRPVRESHLDKPVYRYHQLETMQFSGHGSPMSATIYNKPKEIQVKHQEKIWFYDLWKLHGWDGTLPEKSKQKDTYGLPVQDTSKIIWRIECRLKREALHEMDIEETYDALKKIPALWAYCVGHHGKKDGWLRMVSPNKDDSNRWRWETSEGWQAVQLAFSQGWRGYEDMEDVQRDRKRAINFDRAEAAIAGYATTYSAWLQDEIKPEDDVSVVFQRLYGKILKRWEEKGVDFHELRLKKQLDYHIK